MPTKRAAMALMACAIVSAGHLSPEMLTAQSTLRIRSGVPTAVLKGTVMTDKTERPLLHAKISIPTVGLSAESDSVGDFRITGVPAGSHEVVVELNGFEPLRSSFDFSDGENIAVDFALTERIVQYAPKSAADKSRSGADISRMGLEERRGIGAGRYITLEELTKASGKPTADFIESKVSGLHANTFGVNSRALASDDREGRVEPSDANRNAGAKRDCYIQVLLNGNVMYQNGNGNTLFDINSVPVGMIISADYFTAAQTPPENRTAGARCGTLQILTRGR